MAKNVIYAGPAGQCAQKAEALAGAADLLPGMVMEKTAGAFTKHDEAGQGGAVYFANVDFVKQGGVDDLYTNGDTVQAFNPVAGEFYNLLVATGQNITAVDTPLTSNGAGLLRIAATDGSEEVLCYSEEIVNTAATTSVLVRVAQFGINKLA
jgi:hypothetical protein